MILEQRIASLERESRRLRRGLFGLIAFGAVFLMMGQMKPSRPHKVVQARLFEVIGANGRIVARLGQTRNYGNMLLYTPSGTPVVSAGPSRSGKGFISTYDGKGVRLTAIGVSKEGGGVLSSYNHKGKTQVRIATNAQGGGAITVYNRKGSAHATLTSR
jgi:hypothetical protein